jgi:hypothetical protein
MHSSARVFVLEFFRMDTRMLLFYEWYAAFQIDTFKQAHELKRDF